MTEKPFPDSYWVVPGKFLAGGYPGSAEGDEGFSRLRLAALLAAGVNTFMDLTRPGEVPDYQEALDAEAIRHGITADYQKHAIEDRGLPMPQQMVEILDSIDAALSGGRRIYLHCLGGIGRTGTVVGCWLARHGLTGEAALARLNALYHTSEQSQFFSRSPEVDAQVLFVLDWHEAARSGSAAAEKARKKESLVVDWHARFLQQAAWTRDLRAYVFRRIGLKKTARALEAGCGTGAIWADLSTPAALHGLDLDLARLRQAAVHIPQATLVCGDVRHLPYSSGSFEATLCHFLLLWVPEPVEALREMARVTRAGGYVIAFAEPNYKGRVDKPPALAPLGRWQAESLLRQGADPDLGGRMAALFAQAGISVIETGSLSKDPKKRPTAEEWQQEWAVLQADLGDFVPDKELNRLRRLDQQAWEQGTRLLSVPTYYAWGRVRQMV